MSAPSVADAVAHIAAVAGVAGAGELLDNAALSGIFGHEVSVQHVRVKPGRSVHVAWRTCSGSDTPVWGWAEATSDPDKVRKALLRQELTREPVAVRRNGQAFLVTGGMHGDRDLAKDLVAARRAVGEDVAWDVVRYNPGKRVVAVVDPGHGPAALRVSRRTGRLVDASQRWLEAGVPTLVPVAVGSRGTASLTPWWGDGDLHEHPQPGLALRAGAMLGALHEETRGRDWPGGRLTQPPPDVTAEGLHEVAPWLSERVLAISSRLVTLLAAGTRTDPVWLHGDLSPDQVLHDTDGAIRLVDLDRAGSGPAALDVGSWLAACAATGREQLAEPFLDGYSSVSDVDEQAVGVAEALAQFRAAVDPFRKLWPDWPGEVTRRVELAEAALGRIS